MSGRSPGISDVGSSTSHHPPPRLLPGPRPAPPLSCSHCRSPLDWRGCLFLHSLLHLPTVRGLPGCDHSAAHACGSIALFALYGIGSNSTALQYAHIPYKVPRTSARCVLAVLEAPGATIRPNRYLDIPPDLAQSRIPARAAECLWSASCRAVCSDMSGSRAAKPRSQPPLPTYQTLV